MTDRGPEQTWSTGAAASGRVSCSSSALPRYSSLTRSNGSNVVTIRQVSLLIGRTNWAHIIKILLQYSNWKCWTNRYRHWNEVIGYFDAQTSMCMPPPASITHSNIWPCRNLDFDHTTLKTENLTSWSNLGRINYYFVKMRQAVQETGVQRFFTFDLVATLTLTLRPSKPNQFICRLNYINKPSLMKFRPRSCKISC